jgi:hypothetical protein
MLSRNREVEALKAANQAGRDRRRGDETPAVVAQREAADDAASRWERMSGESNLWYARFEAYRELGSGRSIRKLFLRYKQERGLHAKAVPGRWYAVARRWQWRERAEAWDQAEREMLREQERERRVQSHQRRMDMIDVLLVAVFRALKRADLDALDCGEAREWLPTMRMMFKDLLNAQRAEMELSPDQDEDVSDAITFTADELLVAQRELEEWLKHEAAGDVDSAPADADGAQDTEEG